MASRIAFFFLIIISTSTHATDWPGYLGGDDRNHYSALDQINRANVAQLEVAWTYNTGDAEKDGRSQIQCNPLIIDGVLVLNLVSKAAHN